MKKLFYVVLVVMVLMVIASFVKKGMESEPAIVEEAVVEDVIACDCDAPCTCDESDQACTCAAQRAACDCSGERGDGEIVGDEAEDVVEDNPDATSHEDETIVAE